MTKTVKNTKKNATKTTTVDNVYKFNSSSIISDNRSDFEKNVSRYELAQSMNDKRLYKYDFNASKSSINSDRRIEKTSVNYKTLNNYSKSMKSHADRYTIAKKATVYVRNNSYKVEVKDELLAKLIKESLKLEYTTLTKSFSFKRLNDNDLNNILAILIDEIEESENE